MAHFAELDSNNIVKRVIVVDNDKLFDENNLEVEEIGVNYCKSIFGNDTNWKQTSYNANYRSIYAYPGCSYDEVNDVFIDSPIEGDSPIPHIIV